MKTQRGEADLLEHLMAGDVRRTRSWRSIRRASVAAVCICVLLVGGIGTMGATTVLSGAVSTSGRLEVESRIKKVQHPTGGVVAEILVHDGDHVAADQVLVRLDETVARANFTILRKGVDQLTARLARLVHEQDGQEALHFSQDLTNRAAANAETAEILAGERRLFAARKAARDGQRAQLAERVRQSSETIDGLGAQIEAKDREIALIGSELNGVRDLYARKLVPISRVTQMERDGARLTGERGALAASVAAEKGRIAEVQLQILSIDQQLRQEVAKDIREVQGQIAELSERAVAAEDTLKRLDIRSPQAGTINQSAVHTVGGVVGAGEALMTVVPEHDQLVAEVMISPADIDQVYPGQKATIRLSAFDRTTTPELDALLTYIAADLTKDERTGASYYSAKIAVAHGEIERLKDLKMVPGMPVEAFIRTTDRTILSYLLKPLADQMSRAFRES